MTMDKASVAAESGEPAANHSAMTLISRRHLLIGGAMAATTGFVQFRAPVSANPVVDKKAYESWMPAKVGPWSFVTASGVVLPPPDALSDRTYDNLASRVYESTEMPVVMAVFAYNNRQDGVLQLHRPEVCYPAGGYQLTPTRPVTIQTKDRSIPASFFTATGYERTEQVLYWTRVGNQFPQNWREQRLSVIRANLYGEIPDGMLARVSVLGSDPVAAMPILQKFVTEFEQAVAKPLKKLLVG
jgi:EpsI family protein